MDSSKLASFINDVFSTRKIITKLIKTPLIKPKIHPIIIFNGPSPIVFITLLIKKAKNVANNKIVIKIDT